MHHASTAAVVQVLLDHKANVNALCEGEMVRNHVPCWTCIEAHLQTPLHWACDNPEVSAALLDAKATVDPESVDSVVRLFSVCATPPTDPLQTPLCLAVQANNIQTVRLLLERKANVDFETLLGVIIFRASGHLASRVI